MVTCISNPYEEVVVVAIRCFLLEITPYGTNDFQMVPSGSNNLSITFDFYL
jgi:hypothetical protein